MGTVAFGLLKARRMPDGADGMPPPLSNAYQLCRSGAHSLVSHAPQTMLRPSKGNYTGCLIAVGTEGDCKIVAKSYFKEMKARK